MKRVYALYRVSTAKQVDVVKDDIPMQRLACREYVTHHDDWILEKEFEEKGISGYKVSANDRDAIQDLKDAALHHEFDVLLVFLFDRLGRIEKETPFILEWFVEHDIEMWSVNEGQQKIESHADKLLNYVRFWQASGESEKTSIRVKTRLEQMTSEGLYTGGKVPFGYTLVYNGRKNKKGNEMKDMVPEENEAAAVRKIFSMYVEEGYGSHQIAEYMNMTGMVTHGGAKFQSINILRILKNSVYIGYLKNSNATSARVASYRIIDDYMYDQAQSILEQRANKADEKRTIAMSNKSKALLSGNVYCGHCGCRLATSRYKEGHINQDGSEYYREYVRYVCYHRSRGLNDCDGASTYNAEKIDAEIFALMRRIFLHISKCPQEERVQSIYRKTMKENHKKQKALELSLSKANKQIELLREEIGNALLGESTYTKDDLMALLDSLRKKIAAQEEELKALQDEDAQEKEIRDSIIPAYEQFQGWAEEFENCSYEEKKVIASKLFKRVEMRKGYLIHVELNMSYQHFLENWTENDIEITA